MPAVKTPMFTLKDPCPNRIPLKYLLIDSLPFQREPIIKIIYALRIGSLELDEGSTDRSCDRDQTANISHAAGTGRVG